MSEMKIMSLALSCLPGQKYIQLLLEIRKKLQCSPYFNLLLDDDNHKLEITSEF